MTRKKVMKDDEIRERLIEDLRKTYLYWAGGELPSGTAVCSTLDEEAYVRATVKGLLKKYEIKAKN